MKKYVYTFLCLLFTVGTTYSTIRRIGYTGTSNPSIDYPTFSNVYNASANKDTIQIYGSVEANGVTIAKKLVFMGFGHHFGTNPGLQLATNYSVLYNVNLI